MSEAPVDPSDSEHLTVLEALGAKLGTAPRLSLRDETSGHGRSPVLKPMSDEIRDALPKGKGNYHLMGELARGGMGVVIKAHDDDLGRDVALKILHEELAADPVIVARFVEEAQIGGQLQHPGIVPVYELGLMADDRPFFTMKLVKGRTLSALLKQRRELTQDRRRFLTIFEQVCQTIAYAHSRDVIHRDLKPSNIMVGAFGEVQVVDWGLAKVLNNSSDGHQARTAASRISIIDTVRSGSSTTASDSVAGAVMGTPAYMPPEQARGEIEDLGETADVFALGGLLCQILTGEPPYPGTKDQAMALAESGDQTELSERLSRCDADRDLVDLTRECLAPAAADRPENAGEVAERIHAHLADLEDRARRAEVRAARTLGLSASVVVTLAVAGGAWLWISGERADRRQDELVQDAENVRIEQARVAERRRETEGLVYAALSDAAFSRAKSDWPNAAAAVERARGFLGKEPDTELEQSIDREVQRQERAEILAAEKSEREQSLAQFLGRMERNRGDLWLISNLEYRMNAYEQAFEDFGIDLTYLSEEEVVGASLESGRPTEIALALNDLAWLHFEAVSGKAPRLLRFANLMDPDPIRTKVRDAVAARGEGGILELAHELEARDLPPLTALILVSGLRKTGAKDLSIRILERTVRLHPSDASIHILLGELLLDTDPEGALLHLSVALGLQPDSPYVHQLLGRVYRELGNVREATRMLRRAVTLHADEPQNHIHLGLALRAEGDEEEALESFQTAVEILPGCLEDFLSSHVQFSSDLEGKGLFDSAEWYARRAIEMDEEDERGHYALASALSSGGFLDEAISSYRRVIDINPRHPHANNDLGVVFILRGDLDQAIVNWQRQVEINPNHQHASGNIGRALMDQGRYEEAIRIFGAAIDQQPRSPFRHLRLSWALYHNGDHDAAVDSCRKALDLDPKYCRPLRYLSGLLAHAPDVKTRDAAEAVRLAQKALEVHVDRRVHGNLHLAALHWASLGQAYYRADRFQECVDALVKAIDLSPEAAGGPNDFSLATAHFFLAMAHQGLGDTAEAREWHDEGVDWMESHELRVPQESDLSRWRDEARTVLER